MISRALPVQLYRRLLRDSCHRCARTMTSAKSPRLQMSAGRANFLRQLENRTDAKSLGNTREIPDLQVAPISKVRGTPYSGAELTGSTANLVTASSPSSFKQTFPSGTLQQSQLYTRSSSRATQHLGTSHTIDPS